MRRTCRLRLAPELAVGDGALGFWKAPAEVFPSTRHQRCWFHKIGNVINKIDLNEAPQASGAASAPRV